MSFTVSGCPMLLKANASQASSPARLMGPKFSVPVPTCQGHHRDAPHDRTLLPGACRQPPPPLPRSSRIRLRVTHETSPISFGDIWDGNPKECPNTTSSESKSMKGNTVPSVWPSPRTSQLCLRETEASPGGARRGGCDGCARRAPGPGCRGQIRPGPRHPPPSHLPPSRVHHIRLPVHSLSRSPWATRDGPRTRVGDSGGQAAPRPGGTAASPSTDVSHGFRRGLVFSPGCSAEPARCIP